VPSSEQGQLQHTGGNHNDAANGIAQPQGNIIQLFDAEKQHLSEFSVNNVFGAHSTNTDVFKTIGEPLLDHVLSGYNSCVFAYGQTSSGKTHNMLGGQVWLQSQSCSSSNVLVPKDHSFLRCYTSEASTVFQ
jgi:Kinesin motor domain